MGGGRHPRRAALGHRGHRGVVHQAEYKRDECDLPTHQTEQQAITSSATSAIRIRGERAEFERHIRAKRHFLALPYRRGCGPCCSMAR